jgi:ribulose-5-phosphate 4-epimerase/fuculose-1-phosphate aldolase
MVLYEASRISRVLGNRHGTENSDRICLVTVDVKMKPWTDVECGRNPQDPTTFFISKSLAPALVSRREDLEEYRVADASPVNPNAPRGYLERFIHSEIYKKYKGVNSVVHAHSEVILPFSISSVPLRPVYVPHSILPHQTIGRSLHGKNMLRADPQPNSFHVGAVLGSQAPIYDIAHHYKSSDTLHSLLVTNEHLGAGLAAGFNPASMLKKGTNLIRSFVTSQPTQIPDIPPNPVVLMRGHGFTCIGTSIEEAVYRAVYTCMNARVQTTAMMMQGSFNIGLIGERFGAGEKETGPARLEDLKYLSDKECRDGWEGNKPGIERPWKVSSRSEPAVIFYIC